MGKIWKGVSEMKHKIIWSEIWFHDKTFQNNIPELVAKFFYLGDARLFFNQFYPRYSDRDCSITLRQGNAILNQIVFEVPRKEEGK